MTAPDETIAVVFLGPVTLSDKKEGSLFIPRDVIAQHPDATRKELFDMASAFPKASGVTVGGIYSTSGDIVEGRIKSLGLKALRPSGRFSHKAMIDFELLATARAEEAKIEALARKLKADRLLAREVAYLGQLVRKTPYSQQIGVEAAIMQAIRNAARGMK